MPLDIGRCTPIALSSSFYLLPYIRSRSWKGASLDIWRDKGPSTGMEDAWGAVFNKETPSSVATTITVFYDTHPSLLPDDLLEIPDLRRYFSPDFWPAPHNRALAGMGS